MLFRQFVIKKKNTSITTKCPLVKGENFPLAVLFHHAESVMKQAFTKTSQLYSFYTKFIQRSRVARCGTCDTLHSD